MRLIEWPFAAVVVLFGLLYLARLDDLTIRGEESGRATVAMEMEATGDWVVPRQQGSVHFMGARPPLQAWLIAAAAHGGWPDTLAVRLPSVLAVLLTAALIYAYARTFMSSIGAFASAAGYLSMSQVLQLGRLGETDALFILFVASSILFWHWGVTRGWRPARTWITAYGFVALATLTKGPQAPVYFALSVGLYLLGTRRARFALSWAHAAGIAVFAVIVGAWLVPCLQRVGWDGVRHIFTGDVALYVTDWGWSVLLHYVLFPLWVVACTLPWSPLLLGLLSKGLRDRHGDHVRFLLGAVAITFPTVWLIPGTRPRFFMSLYPMIAVLIGIVIEHSLARRARPARGWMIFARGFAVVIGALAVGLLVARAATGFGLTAAQPWTALVVHAAVTGALAAAMWRYARRAHVAVVCGALFVGVSFLGIYTNYRVARSNPVDAAMHNLRTRMPATVDLVSFGPVHQSFRYFYKRPVRMLPVQSIDDAAAHGVEYFCVSNHTPVNGADYEEIARISCDRTRHSPARDYVRVCRFVNAKGHAGNHRHG